MTTRDPIYQSLDARWRRRSIRTYLTVMAGLVGFMLLVALFTGLFHGNLGLSFGICGIVCAIFAAMILPFFLYEVHCYRALFRDPEEYRIYSAVLDHPSTSILLRGAVYYTVTFQTERGEYVRADTRPMWSSLSAEPFTLEDYNNQTVLVAYRASDDSLIVLGKQ